MEGNGAGTNGGSCVVSQASRIFPSPSPLFLEHTEENIMAGFLNCVYHTWKLSRGYTHTNTTTTHNVCIAHLKKGLGRILISLSRLSNNYTPHWVCIELSLPHCLEMISYVTVCILTSLSRHAENVNRLPVWLNQHTAPCFDEVCTMRKD